MKPLLGGKGANLAEMTRIGLPVPPGFTITTEVCTYYYANKRTYPAGARRPRWKPASRSMEKIMGKKFGDLDEPAARLRPLRRPRLDAGHDGHHPQPRPQRPDRRGAGDQATGNERFAWDCYRRFVQMYGDVVLGVQKRARRGPRAVRDGHPRLQARALSQGHRGHRSSPPTTSKELVNRFKALVKERTGKAVPERSRGTSCAAPSAPCSAPG